MRPSYPSLPTTAEHLQEDIYIMRSSTFIRWSGLASMLGGVLFAAKMWYDRNDAPPWPTDITDTLIFLVPLFWLVGLAGLYAYSRERAGRLGTAGFVVALTGSAMGTAGAAGMSILDIEALWSVFAIGILIMFFGLILAGIATIRAKVFHSWSAALPLLIGALGVLFWFANPDAPGVSRDMVGLLHMVRLVAVALYSAGWVALGYALWSNTGITGSSSTKSPRRLTPDSEAI